MLRSKLLPHPHFASEDPIRAELHGPERLEADAGRVAREHVLAKAPRLLHSPLRARVEANAERLLSVHAAIVEGVRRGQTIPPGAEWFIDNFHVILDQLREIRQDLPLRFDRELAKLAAGELRGLPRVYAIAVELIAHTDNRVELDAVKRFLAAYQRESVLSIGELWAVAIMLRVALVENLRRLASRMEAARRARAEADELSDRVLSVIAGDAPADVREKRAGAMLASALPAGTARRRAPRPAFVVRLVQRLRDQDPAILPALRWLEETLAAEGKTLDEAVNRELQRQAALQTSIANAIVSMRTLSQAEWAEFFEASSGVEKALREDPSGVYTQQDFATRDRMRHAIEEMGDHDGWKERAIAEKAVALARGGEERRGHVGFYLTGSGRPELERAVGYRPRGWALVRRAAASQAGDLYVAGIALVTLAVVALAVVAASHNTQSPALIVLAALVALLPASEMGVTAANFAATLVAPVRRLPKLELLSGVPPELGTLVAVPAILTSEEEVRELVEALEVRALANPDANVRFALVTDLPDGPAERRPSDEPLVLLALRGIEELNARHTGGRFYLLHRARRWNEAEGVWMGWERKRGKLAELNRLLRGDGPTSFEVVSGDRSAFPHLRYVITLDADTQLPRDAARKLVGTIAHPLNRPRTEPGRVVEGYTIVQPRVSESLLGAKRSRFARMLSRRMGIDPYTTAVSDVYQDVFGEASFTGKGIYDVDAFREALRGRVPENALLSHDLFEGCFARCGLASDIELYEDHPYSYDVYAQRLHRWVRGDWQLVRWLGRKVPCETGRTKSELTPLARWKMLDNLRRSLVPAALLLWLAAAWTILPGSPAFWTALVLVVMGFPVLLDLSAAVTPAPRGIPWLRHAEVVLEDTARTAIRIGLSIALLPFAATVALDAAVRALYRQFVSHRRLLDWTAAAAAEKSRAQGIARYVRRMAPSLVLTAALALLVAAASPSRLPLAVPFLLLWLAAPVIAEEISRPIPEAKLELSAADRLLLRDTARKTWRFFETLVTERDRWLPPDNLQEDPETRVAHRTSPTNIGLALLATVAARDFGWIGVLEMTERLERMLTSIEALPRYRGHLFNWYDTVRGTALHPRYVSTVDSGNLAACALTLEQACASAGGTRLAGAAALAGFHDALRLLTRALDAASDARYRTGVVTMRQVRTDLDALATLLADGASSLPSWQRLTDQIVTRCGLLEDALAALAHEHGGAELAEARSWVARLAAQARSHARDLALLAPDVPHGSDPASGAHEAPDVPAAVPVPNGHAAIAERLPTVDELPEREGESARGLPSRLSEIARRAGELAEGMEFGFLFDAGRKLFTIGWNADSARRDDSFYDLLASEARVASFLAIAKGEVPTEHWFRMGRPFTVAEGEPVLLSWSGSMFEYLMPDLLMASYPGSLLHDGCVSAIRAQIAYARRRGVPWGISEAAYNARDLDLNYQYGPFGVPLLGLKRVGGNEVVVAPYATFLALAAEPARAMENIRALVDLGMEGPLGFYESVDFTKKRLPPRAASALIRAYMAHHQGMILLAIDNALLDHAMSDRFRADPSVQATDFLLQEMIPRHAATLALPDREISGRRVVREQAPQPARRYETVESAHPRTHLLSNGSYATMVSAAGAGWSRRGNLAVTRWRGDGTRDAWGSWVYLRDVRSGSVWSAGYQPVGREPRKFEALFSEEKVEITRLDAGVQTRLEVVVSAEDDAEVRRVSLTNTSMRAGDARDIEVTSYAEMVLAPIGDDLAHPAFASLFVESEVHGGALLFRRRPRASDAPRVFGVHTMAVEGTALGAPQWETDRSRFLGRGHTAAAPAAIIEDRPLSGTVGAVLDPIASLRQRIRIQPGETARITFTTAVAGTRDAALALADKFKDPHAFERGAALAWMRAQALLKHLNIAAEEAFLFQRLASYTLYQDPALRPKAEVLARCTRYQRNLWSYGISGDLPIVLVKLSAFEEVDLARQLIRAHEYWRLKGLAIELVILNEHPSGYLQPLQEQLQAMAAASPSHGMLDRPGGIFIRRADAMPEEDRLLLETVAHAVLSGAKGTLAEQLDHAPRPEAPPARLVPTAPTTRAALPSRRDVSDLLFWNGIGGFTPDGKEFTIVLGDEQWTLAPWINIVANPRFGFQVSETGSGCAWSGNSRENRLTPWSNDAVSDPPGEAVYVRDEETGEVWTPTALPIREPGEYVASHGRGYTRFSRTSHGVAHELLVFVPPDDPVKLSRLTLTNVTEERKRLGVTYYVEWVLGVARETSAPFVATELDGETGALFARNPYNEEFATLVAFADAGGGRAQVTGDRREFLGRHGGHARPAALRREALSGRVGAGFDPCGALKVAVDLAPGETRELVFQLGQATSAEKARLLVSRYRRREEVEAARERAVRRWEDVLGAVEVRTPDPALDVMLNGPFLYQTLACRVWGRSAFYQASGAYGFRDQLQDVMALVAGAPDVTREQIVRAASRQFLEGDVQHWWHPPSGRGVRTRCSDDLLWLPYAVARYVEATGDRTVLDEEAAFLEAPPLAAGEDEAYLSPRVSEKHAPVFEHAALAIEKSLATGTGAHGVPLMGAYDWNDGFNRVGKEGKGESVWLGWFQIAVLDAFAPICEERGEVERAERYRTRAKELKRAIEDHAWDGDWYKRAWYDDGTPLGSASDAECRIDSIAQTWGVLSGAADRIRAERAMVAVDEHLVRRNDGLILLFTPPFDRTPKDPGYIKGYLPGVRENGGQYSHAAAWTIMAFAALGDGDRALELLQVVNPISHAATRASVHRYRVEPYVMAGDVYSVAPLTGRGGWTWYTGSAGWMWRAGVESLLGFRLRGDHFAMDPCIPRGWPRFELTYRDGGTRYDVTVENPRGLMRGVSSVELDGRAVPDGRIPRVKDGGTHSVKVVLGS